MSTPKKPAQKATVKKTDGAKVKKVKVGKLVKAVHVINPHGVKHEIAGGMYVLDIPGTFIIDGTPYEAE